VVRLQGMITTKQRDVLRRMRNVLAGGPEAGGNVTEAEVQDCIAALDAAMAPAPTDVEALRAEAVRTLKVQRYGTPAKMLEEHPTRDTVLRCFPWLDPLRDEDALRALSALLLALPSEAP
jgi:hypothetical protein